MHRVPVFLLGLHLAFVHAIPIADYDFTPMGNAPNHGTTFGDTSSPRFNNIDLPFLTSSVPSSPRPQALNPLLAIPQDPNPLLSIEALNSIVPQSEQELGAFPQNEEFFPSTGDAVPPLSAFTYDDDSSREISQAAPWVFNPQDYDCPEAGFVTFFLGCCDTTDRTNPKATDDEFDSCVAVSQDPATQTKCKSLANTACCNHVVEFRRRQLIASGATQPATPDLSPFACNSAPTIKKEQNSNPPT